MRRVMKRIGPSRGISTRGHIHSFRRKLSYLDLQGNAVYAPYLNAFSFNLSNVPGLADFTGLFDHYRIKAVKLSVYLRKDPSADTAANAIYPRMWWALDYDDATTPASLNELREHGNVKTRVLTQFKPVNIYFKPATLALSYASALASTYSPKWGEWIDMANTQVPYFGWKVGIDNHTVTNQFIAVEATYYFQCKAVR